MSLGFGKGSLTAASIFVALWLTLLATSATAGPAQRANETGSKLPERQQEDVQVYLPLQRTLGDAQTPLCRLGVNGHITGFDMTPFRIGWYQDYEANRRARQPNGVEYTPVVRLSPAANAKGYRYSIKTDWGETTEAELLAAIDALPGAHWHIGNEPDRPSRLRGGQDAVSPQVYARAYHELYHLIKNRDSTAKIVAGNIVQPTPVRLQYLDLVLKTYQETYNQAMPVDVWGIHNFILNEVSCSHPDGLDCWGAEIPDGVDAVEGMKITIPQVGSFDLFVQQIRRFREWLALRGYKGYPVHLSEYGILIPPPDRPPGFFEFPFSVVNEYMDKTFDYLRTEVDTDLGDPTDGYRLIQRFSWYSVSDVGYGGFLFEPMDDAPRQFKLSPGGENYIAYAARLEEEIDFAPVRILLDPPAPLTANGPTTVTVSALIGNAGNTSERRSATVRFYNGNPARNGRQIGEDQVISLAGCGDDAIAQVEWPNVSPGNYRVYVVVDPQQAVAETREDNNRTSQAFFFAEGHIFLPSFRQHLP